MNSIQITNFIIYIQKQLQLLILNCKNCFALIYYLTGIE